MEKRTISIDHLDIGAAAFGPRVVGTCVACKVSVFEDQRYSGIPGINLSHYGECPDKKIGFKSLKVLDSEVELD